jgi:DNA polymerase elongation subunit (family B)
MEKDIRIGNDNNKLIYDIESATIDGKPDATKDVLKIVGVYSYIDEKLKVIPAIDKEYIKKIFNVHKFLIGFNNKEFDNVILKRFGYDLEYKRVIDLYEIIKKRAGVMATDKGRLQDILMEYTLDYITRTLGLVDDETAKDEIDYNIFKKDKWTSEERKDIIKYTKRDLEITKKLYEYIEKYFEPFKEFISQNDIDGKYYLTDSIAKFTYKAICHAMKWEPIYNTDFNVVEQDFEGGYVSYPSCEKASGNIYCIDFNSAYPHIMIMCNLYGRNKKSKQGWHGGGVWDVEGYYDDNVMSDISKVIRKWYYLRMFYKLKGVLENGNEFKFKNISKYIGQKFYTTSENKDSFDILLKEITPEIVNKYLELCKDGINKKEYTIKICINTMYGILSKSYYELVHDQVAAADCTRIGRQWVKYMRKKFREAGYELLYTDSDSVYIKDVFNDKERMLKVKDEIIKDILNTVPFPQPTFDAGIDAEIKHIYFFKGRVTGDKDSDNEMDEDDFINKPKGLMKKNYIYVTTDNKLTIKNLGIARKNVSALSKKIFWDYLSPQIINGKIKFKRTEIDNLMKRLLREDITLAYMRKNVDTLNKYNKSLTGIQAQISKRYGPGIHFLIPNIRGIGVGKQIKYCSIDEFNKYDMSINDIDYTNFWKELNYFIETKKTYDLFNWG